MEKQSETGHKHPLTGHSEPSDNAIFCIPRPFKGIPPVMGKTAGGNVSSMAVLNAKKASGISSPATLRSEQQIEQRLPEGKALESEQANEQRGNASLTDDTFTVNDVSYVTNPDARVIGTYTVVYDRLSDGSQVLKRKKYVPVEPPPANLREIWGSDSGTLSFSYFIIELIRHGIVIQDLEHDRLVWPHQAVTIKACINLLVKNRVIKDLKCWDKFYTAFTGTFHTNKVSQARSLRSPAKSLMNWGTRSMYREKEKAFTNELNQIFFFR